MADISGCQEKLCELAERQGYLTFDDILNASDAFSLSVSEVDFLSEAIQLRGIIVYETVPQTQQQPQSDEDELDYSRTDYEAIFSEILELAPQLKMLVKEIASYPAPQYGEVNQLIMQIAEGNHFARERLIALYMRSVLKIALSMTKQYELDLEDAISSGFIGLINAVDRYDPAGFSVFHSYASLWIQQSIQRDCNPTWMDYYFPAHYKEKMFRSLQKYEQYTAGEEIGTTQYYEQILRISHELNLPETDVDNAIQSTLMQKYGKISAESLIEWEYSSAESLLHEFIGSEEDVLEGVFQRDLSSIIENALSSLTEREAKVVRMRNGIGYCSPMTLEDIGGRMNVTRERVRQIENKALRKLAHSSRKKILDCYISETARLKELDAE